MNNKLRSKCFYCISDWAVKTTMQKNLFSKNEIKERSVPGNQEFLIWSAGQGKFYFKHKTNLCDKFNLLVRKRVDSFLLKLLEITLIAPAFVVSVVYVPILVYFFLEIPLNLKKQFLQCLVEAIFFSTTSWKLLFLFSEIFLCIKVEAANRCPTQYIQKETFVNTL